MKLKKQKKRHSFHIVDYSPWPSLIATAALFFTLSLGVYFTRIEYSLLSVYWQLFLIILIMYKWWKDVNTESVFSGAHTRIVVKGLWLGFILFMLSEVMIFFVFFWGYFHYSLTTAYEIGFYWPAVGVSLVKTYRLPLLNTLILILSGITLTIAHKSLLIGDYRNTQIRLILTILLGLTFEILQVMEYSLIPYNMNDAVFGNIFYFLTGLHGFHVLVGIIFLTVCFVRLKKGYLLKESHIGFEFAIWYWHFVDIVWILSFFVVYWW